MSNRSAAALALMFAITPTLAAAQVGHDPATSPFRDILTHHQLALMVGNFGGNTGKAGAGARPGTAIGLRFRTQLSGSLDLVVRGTRIASSRIVIDPTKPDSIRRSGPADLNMIGFDIGIALKLTGPKTWHGLAPWLGFGAGVIAPTNGTTDPGGFKAGGINFTFTPSVGTAIHFSRQLALQLEARDNTIRYEWPLAYFNPRDANNNPLPPPVLAAGERDRQLTHNFTLSAGLSYHFNF